MKKLKIKNPILRGLAGASILIPCAVIGLIALIFISYGAGQLLQPVYAEHHALDNDYPFWISVVIGYFEIVLIAISAVILFALYKGSVWAGNYCFSNANNGKK